jgi:hypothetical protein
VKRAVIFSLIVVAFLTVPIVTAQSGGGYDLTWSTIDGGGGASSGGGYTLAGTIGQPDAALLTGGGYTLNGGFWGGVGGNYHVYLPLILRQATSTQ